MTGPRNSGSRVGSEGTIVVDATATGRETAAANIWSVSPIHTPTHTLMRVGAYSFNGDIRCRSGCMECRLHTSRRGR